MRCATSAGRAARSSRPSRAWPPAGGWPASAREPIGRAPPTPLGVSLPRAEEAALALGGPGSGPAGVAGGALAGPHLAGSIDVPGRRAWTSTGAVATSAVRTAADREAARRPVTLGSGRVGGAAFRPRGRRSQLGTVGLCSSPARRGRPCAPGRPGRRGEPRAPSRRPSPLGRTLPLAAWVGADAVSWPLSESPEALEAGEER